MYSIRFLRLPSLLLAVSLLLQVSFVKAEDFSGVKLNVIPRCTVKHQDEGFKRVCAELLNQSEIEEVKAMRFAEVYEYKAIENGLILAVKLKRSDLVFFDRPAISGEVTTFLEAIDTELFAIKVRFKGIEKAKLNPLLFNLAAKKSIRLNIDGREPSERVVVEDWTVVLKKLQDNGAQYQSMPFLGAKNLEPKNVEIFRGRHCASTITGCKIIYTADGGIEAFIVNADAARIQLDDFIFVGIPSSNENRIGELLKGRDQENFDAFLRFVATDLRLAIEKNETPKGRYVAGYSNGGAWALDALLFHPELFDGAILMSPAAWELQSRVNLKNKKLFVGAGELEMGYIQRAQEIVKIMGDLGAEVKTSYSKSGHSMNTWVPIWNMALRDL